jgi:hypothetical protein
VIDPYLEKVQQRLNPEFQANWPTSGPPAGPPAGPESSWPLPSWPGPQPQIQWPQSSPPQSNFSAPAWPSQPSQPSANNQDDPYAVPREPNPFPSPYSAERTTGGTF